MKKAILLSTLTTILTLSLAGCGSTGGLEDSVGVQNSTAPTANRPGHRGKPRSYRMPGKRACRRSGDIHGE